MQYLENEMKDYYKILEIQNNATQEQIKKAYRNLAKKYHPDLNHNDKFSEEKFKSINEAYTILGDMDKRREYEEYIKRYNANFYTRSEYNEDTYNENEEYNGTEEYVDAEHSGTEEYEDEENNQTEENSFVGCSMWLGLILLILFVPFLGIPILIIIIFREPIKKFFIKYSK